MVVVMAADAEKTDVDGVVERVREAGGDAFVSRGLSRTIVGLVGDIDQLDSLNLRSMPGVSDVMRITAPYKLVSREHRQERSVIRVAGVPIGPDTLTVIAGPCSVESEEQVLRIARGPGGRRHDVPRRCVQAAHQPLRLPRPRRGRPRDAGQVREVTGMPIVTEVLTPPTSTWWPVHRHVADWRAQHAELPPAGGVGRTDKAVLLKRGPSATIEEWLLAAEYMAQGNRRVILCERGIRTYETATRNTFDINAVELAKRVSHLPVIVDPSHSGGRRDLVVPLSRAAIAVGADGIIVDVHPTRRARCATARRPWWNRTCVSWPAWPPTFPPWWAGP